MSSPSVSTSPWQPLPPGSIRLLELEGTQAYTDPHRGILEAAVVCKLLTVSRAELGFEDIQYGALSYVWGSTRGKRPLICNGHHQAITANLYDALWQFVSMRQPDAKLPRYLWVDAVCINQSDEAEKSSQVAQMGDIYRNASKVIVWLGTCSAIAGNHFEDFWDKMRLRYLLQKD